MTSDVSGPSWYETTADSARIAPEVAEQAIEWLMTLQAEPVAPAVIEAWRQWRTEHPDHERAWQRIEAVQGRLQPLLSEQNAAIARATLAGTALRAKRAGHRRRAIKAMALLAFAGGAGYMVEQHTPWRAWAAQHRTRVGERRMLALEDGTQVVMNTDSALDVRFDAQERRLRLVSGEVLVRTAQQADRLARPFLVETAQGTARAMGTWYAVRGQAGRTEVSVFEGAVEIRLGRSAQPALVVYAGQQVSFTGAAVSQPVPAHETQIAWRDGFIEARSLRLDDFLAELARYSTDRLTCDPAIAHLRVSGSFPVEDVDRVVSSLAVTLGVRVETAATFLGRRRIRLVQGQSPAAGVAPAVFMS